jgi:hypothetical protein
MSSVNTNSLYSTMCEHANEGRNAEGIKAAQILIEALKQGAPSPQQFREVLMIQDENLLVFCASIFCSRLITKLSQQPYNDEAKDKETNC